MKLVFVDDSKIVLKTLKALIQDMLDAKTIECEFLNESALVKEKLEDRSLEYDVLFVDINMPHVSGYELAQAAKSIDKYKFKPIIAITSEFTDEAKKLGEDFGIDGWFIKSINQDSLQSSIVDVIKQLYKGKV